MIELTLKDLFGKEKIKIVGLVLEKIWYEMPV